MPCEVGIIGMWIVDVLAGHLTCSTVAVTAEISHHAFTAAMP